MKVNFGRLRRLAYSALALAVLGAAMVPALSGTASAAQVTDRYIKMDSSTASATGVTYEIGFKVAQAGAVQGVGVDFCANSPIIGDTCTAPDAPFTVGAGTTTGSITGMTGTWSGTSAQSGRILVLTLATPSGTAASGAQATFTLTTATNPGTANDTFYARVYTFATSGAATSWATGNTTGADITGVVDSGGVALSTAAQLLITAKVQETLTFCVYTGVNCAAAGTAVNIGDTNGVLSTSGPFVNKEGSYDVATNASSGAAVRFKAALPTSGANTLASISSTGATSSPGTTQFGLCTYASAGSNLTFDTVYDGAAAAPAGECSGTTDTAGTGIPGGDNGAQFAFDTSAAATTYGDDLATASAGASSTGKLVFLGNVSPTQAAGIYTSTFTFIATGTY